MREEIKNIISEIGSSFDELEKQNECLHVEIIKLRDEHYNDYELAKMKAECEQMQKELNRGFGITETEQEAISVWIDEHDKKHGKYPTAGERYSYVFCPTGFGTIGTIKCCCGKEFCFRGL